MSSTKVLVADANSTDGTREVVLSFRDRLNVSVIRGGMPSVGRNLGAAHAESTYVLFLDADIELAHPSVVRRAVELAQRRQLHCVTTNILCRDGSWIDKLFYAGNDFFQYLSRLHHPFRDGNVHAVRIETIPETSGISRASRLRRRLPAHAAGGAKAIWNCAWRCLHHQPSVQEDGAYARGLVVSEDCDELLESELLFARPQILADVSFGCARSIGFSWLA